MEGISVMQIHIFDTVEFSQINKLQEVSSPTLLIAGAAPDPDGLISNEIFGVSTKKRKRTFAYINLYSHFLHPHIYVALRRLFANLPNLIGGTKYYRIDDNGYLVEDDENGETGIEFLYNNWEKIKFRYDSNDEGGVKQTTRNTRISVIKGYKKDEVFMTRQIVIPAFYRDIKTGSNSSGGSTDDINRLYQKLIRETKLIQSSSLYSVQFHNTNLSIQLTIVNIYEYFKEKLKGKKGLIRKYLMGKNVDYCTRSVITANNVHANTANDLEVSYEYASIPISQACTMAYPFIEKYILDFFDRELISNNNAKIVYDPKTDTIKDVIELKSPATYFTEKYVKKMVDTYQKDFESRFNPIEVPTTNEGKYYLVLSGRRFNPENKNELSPIVNRPMTWTDLLYIACESVLKDKHVLLTRYPVLNEFATIVNKIRISSTTKTVPMLISGVYYKNYPDIDINIPKDDIGINFIDSVRFSHSYLPGLDKHHCRV
jgi:DNA-directed RNA polymerase beta' subunit